MSVLHCPHCRKPLSVTEAHAGVTVVCPGCGKSLKVPGPRPAPAPEEPPGDFDRIDEEPRRPRKDRPVAVQIPVVFHVAAWMFVALFLLIGSGCFVPSVKVRDTTFSLSFWR